MTNGGSEFGVSPMELNLWKDTIESVAGKSDQIKGSMTDIRTITQEVARLSAEMSQADWIDPTMLEDVKELRKLLKDIGVPAKQFLKIQKDIKAAMAGELLMFDQLTKKEQKAAQEKARQQIKEKTFTTTVMGERVSLSDKEGINQGKIDKTMEKVTKKMGDQVKQVGKFATSTAGIQLSLIGILMLILKIHNNTRKMSAMGMQMNQQYADQNKNLKGAKDFISGIESGFKLSYEAAGEFGKSLAKAGLEQKEIEALGNEILGIQFAQGISAEEQVGHIKNLVNNLDQTAGSAQDYLVTMREAAKDLGKDGILMSMQEFGSDWKEILDSSRSYNTNLLDTLSFYSTLVRKSEEIGLDEIPLEVRQGLAKTVAAFSRDLSDGWKAALGEGGTIAEKIIDFETMKLPEQFAALAKHIEKVMGQAGGETMTKAVKANKQILIREALKPFLSSTEMREGLAVAFEGGAFTGDRLKDFLKSIATERGKMEEIEGKAGDIRAKLLTAGQTIATELTNLETLLAKWVERKLRPLVNKLVSSLDRMSDVLGVLTTGVPSTPKGMGTALNVLVPELAEKQRKAMEPITKVLRKRAKEMPEKLRQGLLAKPKVGVTGQAMPFEAMGIKGALEVGLGRGIMKLDPERVKELYALSKKNLSAAIAGFNKSLEDLYRKESGLKNPSGGTLNPPVK